MDPTSLIIEMLKQKQFITPLEQDILDTYHELNKRPFERDSAIQQSQKNNINHPDIFVEISAKPTTVFKPWTVASDEDVYSNLSSQFEALENKYAEQVKCIYIIPLITQMPLASMRIILSTVYGYRLFVLV